MKIILIIGIIVAVGFIGMKLLGSKSATDKKVNIRIQNASNQDIENFWLGAGGKSGYIEAYGALKKGETTSYRKIDATWAAYRKTDFLIGEKRYGDVVYPEQFVGNNELKVDKYYTFSYTIENDKAVLNITEDPAQNK